MTRLTRIRIDRRRVLAGGAALFAGTVAFRKAGAQSATAIGPGHAICAEFSPDSKLLKAGWNTRVFTHTDARRGNGIRCDFVTRDHHLGTGPAPLHRCLAWSLTPSGGEPAEMTTVRAPASAGYCRLRTVGPNRVLNRGYARRRQRATPVSSASEARAPRTSLRACSKRIWKPTRPWKWCWSMNRGAIRSKSTCGSSPRIPLWHAMARISILSM